MSWANCSRCGKVYNQVPGGRDICLVCIKEEENNYTKIFHYLSTRPSATAQEISQETGVDLKEIFRYVRENRLMLVKVDTGLFCETCGIPISQGKMCEKCIKMLSDDLKNDLDKFKKQMKTQKNEIDNEPKLKKRHKNI